MVYRPKVCKTTSGLELSVQQSCQVKKQYKNKKIVRSPKIKKIKKISVMVYKAKVCKTTSGLGLSVQQSCQI